MIRYAILFLAICAFTKKAHASDGYTLKGTVSGNYEGYIYLSYDKVKDSTLVVNNTFEFAGKVDKPIQAWLNLRPDANIAWVYLENNEILLTADFRTSLQDGKLINWLLVKEINGSYGQKIKDQYYRFCEINRNKENYDQLLFEEVKRICQENPKHPVSGTLLSPLSANLRFSYEEFEELSTIIDTAAMHRYDVEQLYVGMHSLRVYGAGQGFFPFNLRSTSGDNISLNQFTGKFVLIDFWASWCKPCREKHPALLSLQKKFKEYNVEIVGISVDKDEVAWKKAIELDRLTWNNVLDRDQKVMKEIGVQAIPILYLLDKSGKILMTGTSLEKFDEILSKLVK